MSRISIVRAVLFTLAFLGAALGPGWAQTDNTPSAPTAAGAVIGRVVTASGEAATDARVTLVELRRKSRVDEGGRFRFEGVPAGDYIVRAESGRAGLSVTRVQVAAGQEASLEMTLDLATHQEMITVTARPDAATLGEVAQPVDVLTGSDLTLKVQPTLGETLAQQPGVSSTYFGPGASRPVIRGMGGDRIRVLQDSLGTADASNISPDHAVSFDPLAARSVEILRGPATLLYGSNAVGGVVNIIDDRIPEVAPDRPIRGVLDLAGGTVADEFSGAASLGGGTKAFAWHGDFARRNSGDLSIPGFAESQVMREAEGEADEEPEGVEGVLENSATEATNGAVGVSLLGERGFLGASFGGFDTLYGVPGHHHPEGEAPAEPGAEEEPAVRIDLRQRRGDLRGEWRAASGPFSAVRLRLGMADYEHMELEGDAIGTTFTNDSWEGRLHLNHRPLGPFTGAIGVQGGRRDFVSVGEEAVVPPTLTTGFAVFAFEELGTGAWRLQLGGRYDTQDVDAEGETPLQRSFDGFSGSIGALWQGAEGWGAALTLARSVKLPTAEELYSNGPHLATNAFEVGDADLREENSLGVDLSFRKREGRVTGQLNFFANRFDDFIFEQFTGGEEDGLPVAQFIQRDADFVGGEASAVIELFHAEPHHVDLELMADYVRAELRDGDQPLPRIPPFRWGAGLHYGSQRWTGRVEVRATAEQDRLAPNELRTEGYTLLNASLAWRAFFRRNIFEVLLRGTNLTDEEARNHVSFLKDLAPLPGRDVRLSLRLTF